MEELRHEGSRHNCIAVLGAEVNEAYQAELWRGITEEAERHSKKLVCFMGSRIISSPPNGNALNPFYRLAHSGNFDGIIVISSAVSTYLDPEQVQSLFDVRPDLPKVSIGLQVKGVGSVCVDSRHAMKQITEHLVIDHGRRNFAVVAGPRRHPESEQRRKTVMNVLNTHGLKLKPEMLIHGTFEHSSGKTAMKNLIKSGNEIDAVICLNDQMAIGVIEELTESGISVPDMISVTGFDGIEESEYCSPPLSTVNQPLYEVGASSVKELYRLMGGKAPRNVMLPCLPLIRQSCACSTDINLSGHNGEPLPSKPSRSFLRHSLKEEQLVALLSEDNPESFLQEVDKLVTSSTFLPGDFFLLDNKFNRIEKSLPGPTVSWVAALSSARKILWQKRTRYLINLRIQKQQRNDLLRTVGSSLSGAFELPELFSHLAEGLLMLGFRHGYLIIYSYKDAETLPEFRLFFRLKNGIYNPLESVSFVNTEILPEIIEELDDENCTSWMFAPLVFQHKAIGHMLLPGTHPDSEIYETLSRQIASSLQGAMLLEQVKTHEQSLVKEVQRRTKELTKVNSDLRQEIATRIRLEREVIDISKHTMERIGQDLHDDLCQHLAGVSLHVSALRSRVEKAAPEALPVADLINRLLSDSIGRTKRIVRGLLPFGIADEGISNALRVLCSEISESSGMRIEFSDDNNLILLSADRAIELYRIVQEALNNAIKHSGGTLVKVRLESEKIDEAMVFSVIIQDDGRGFKEDDRNIGMGLKIMRYRGERAEIEVDVQTAEPGIRVVCKGKQQLAKD